MIRKWIRNYFGFSQKEANGTIVLFIIMLLIIGLPMLFRKLTPSKTNSSQKDIASLDSLIATIEVSQDSDYLHRKPYPKYTPYNENAENFTPKVLFLFNPNTLSTDSFLLLGMSQKLALRIDNYRKKGGKFRLKKDVKKMYGLPEPLYNVLQSYIALPDTFERKKYAYTRDTTAFRKKYDPNAFKAVVFDANSADSTAFIKLKGIGAGAARRIIRYRTRLGGFISQNQYKEVFGLDSLALAELEVYAKIQSPPQKININTASETALKHPYMPYKLPKLIVSYRLQHGDFKSIDELSNIKVIKPEDITKLKPYLSTE